MALVHDHDATDVSGATNQTLANPHDLDPTPDVDRPLARAILTGEFADAGVDSERFESRGHECGGHLEPLVNTGFGVVDGQGKREGDGLGVEDGSSPTGQPLDGIEAVCSGSPYRGPVTSSHPVGAPEGNHGGRDVEPQRRSHLTGRHTREDRMAKGHVQRAGVALLDQCEGIHSNQDKDRDNEGWAIRSPERFNEELPFMGRYAGKERVRMRSRPTMTQMLLAGISVVVLTACVESPLESIGLRSSDWINEPTVPTTLAVDTTIPTFVSVDRLQWSNDGIVTENLGDGGAMLAEIFDRREGDRFIQSSRVEIAAALPDVGFPDLAPHGAQWVSSQLVFENDGTLSNEPTAAFGIWSAEPYTRSRSVAQMIVLRVSNDLEAATELATGAAEASCARFADRAGDECEIITVGDRETWLLGDSSGSTLIWYEGPYRYEMYGRTFVPEQVLQQMSGSMTPLSSIGVETS